MKKSDFMLQVILELVKRDGKTWKVSRDNIFDPAKLLEK